MCNPQEKCSMYINVEMKFEKKLLSTACKCDFCFRFRFIPSHSQETVKKNAK